MKTQVFESGLKEHLDRYLALKRAAGFKYDADACTLAAFDKMTAHDFPEAHTVTEEMCAAWIQLHAARSPKTLNNYVTTVAQFCAYLNTAGVDAFVPYPGDIRRGEKYEPHIFTQREISALFDAIDADDCRNCRSTTRYVRPMIFRLLYLCGMRSSEARLLARADVDLTTGSITIRESKRWRQRIIYMHSDLLPMCREYDGVVEGLLPGREPFFPNWRGEYFSEGRLSVWFHKIWDGLPFAANAPGNPPRVHDLRHTFCVHCLDRWAVDGKDLSAMYPYLSAYLGHKGYEQTDYYLHLTASFYPELAKKMAQTNARILNGGVSPEGR